MSTLPPDWRFKFMGSDTSVAHVNKSASVRQQVKAGKLDLMYIPSNMSTAGQEMISRFLTNQWLYETVLAPAEWLLMYQTDSMMCGNHKGTLDEWLDYDWVGAPWYLESRYGGNGGLSLRRVSSILEVLRHQQRANNSDPEDVWLTERLGHLPNSRTANGTESLMFSGEAHWYDYPLGYHTGGSGEWLVGGIWGTPEKRNHIYKYCPEMKLTLKMDTKNVYPTATQLNRILAFEVAPWISSS
ncbi:uncharacterized protein AB675_8161 [Cyphellophora attinorum]|uniref:DUF5672 domain-containing protein n=1 Tax=Cyphellophora attinorum TaxID=1664694 RepID=A0A0N1HS17_9EURO|nr:uncharacterized protein AB675_8161 [Phialophora attinorum]KPI41285.1 hypothetical protein AB675_8161 [Phialophora attinorum]